MRSLITTAVAGLSLAASLSMAPAVQAEQDWQYEEWATELDPRDPWESWNRKVFQVNDTLDRWALRPVAKGYQKVTPQPVRNSVRNVFNNLGEPKNLVNNLLQGKLHAAGVDTSRFLFNSTFGVLGLFDVASKMGLQRNDEDFGQTLGKWGVGSGPYVVLPLLGPSTLRDAPALVPDYYTGPYPHISPERARYGTAAVDVVSKREELLRAENLIIGDKYVFVRNAWLQNREYRVHDGEIEDDFDDF